ncbi:MAG: hypothetical protein NTX98_00325 [Candidatus Doudnabacteria bacterium]|nr:hypothetical protein [Candidatus Doudnabacteria bacterium]
MNKISIGILFVIAGVAYGSMAIDSVYRKTLGYLVENKWITLPKGVEEINKNALGRKGTIILYSLILISIGIYLIWNRNI